MFFARHWLLSHGIVLILLPPTLGKLIGLERLDVTCIMYKFLLALILLFSERHVLRFVFCSFINVLTLNRDHPNTSIYAML